MTNGGGWSKWWTEERVAELRARWANNETYAQIHVAMKATSRNAVIGKAHRLKLFRSPADVKASRNTNGRHRRRQRRTPIVLRGEPMIEEKPPVIFANPKRFIELEAKDCHWPSNEPPGPNMACCGAPTIDGFPYCRAHARMAYHPPSRPRL